MRTHGLHLILLVQVLTVSAAGQGKHVVDIGAKDDTAYVGAGVYHREGPYPKDRHGDFHAQPFRWARNNFILNIPTFPNKDSVVALHMKMVGGDDQRAIVEAGGTAITVLRANKSDPFNYGFVIPASIVGEQTMVPVTFRATVSRVASGGGKEKRVLFCALAKASVTPREPEKGAVPGPKAGVSLLEVENTLYLSNGRLSLWFGQPEECIVSGSFGIKRAGKLRIFMVQFEKEGMGYKGTGIQWIPQERIKSISHDVTQGDRAVVTVTVERTQSAPAKRMFEADVRVTVLAGEPHFQAELVRVKNMDTLPYRLRGFFFKLQPFPRKPKPIVWPDVAAWVMDDFAFGAVTQKDGDFAMEFRRDPEGRYHGEITRKLDVALKPGEEWKGRPAAVIVFATDQTKPEAVYREAMGLRR